ncbi:restriction endonuclease subunit S [Pseudomonas sp. KnCO4]|uniref:restriction endonuclease subunit S n=1 Tax=Pseudomonas sp. KnCO4 TaxID=3381355 RepID=UPI0038782293
MADQIAGMVPRIRFKAYSEPWAEEKIGDVLAEKRRPIVLEDVQRYELITVKRRNEGVVSRGHLLGRNILVKNYAQLKAGDFVISKRQVVHGATGIVPPALDGAIVSNEYLAAVDNEKLLSEFLAIVASLPAMRRKFFLSSYGVDIEKLFFDADDWKKRSVILPDVQEQSRIGQFFQKLDQLIALHHRKHGRLLALKAAMLQRMFPKPGAVAPDVRLSGFSGAWTKCKLADISEIKTGPFGSALHASDYVPDGSPIITTEHFKNWSLPKDKRGIPQVSESDYKRLSSYSLRSGDLVFSRVGSVDINARVLATQAGWLFSGRVLRVRLQSAIDSEYMHYELSTDRTRRDVVARSVGQTMPSINTKILGETEVLIPPYFEEQNKIGAIFRKMDELVEKHATQFEKLRQIKLAFLEEMFP